MAAGPADNGAPDPAPPARTPPPPRDAFDRVQRIARLLLAPYIIGVLLAVPAVFGLMAYGLAHASGRAGSQFLVLLVGGAAVAIAVPLTVLLPGRGLIVRAIKSIGLLVMLAGLAAQGKLLWHVMIHPALMTADFHRQMNKFEIGDTQESPLYLDGRLAGVHVVINVRARHRVTLDDIGRHALELLQQPDIALVEGINGDRMSPFTFGSSPVAITKDGTPLESLPGLARRDKTDRSTSGSAVLPAGTYRVERDYWLWGLQQPFGETTPCRGDDQANTQLEHVMQKTQGRPMRVVMGTRLGLPLRMGYRYFELDSKPLQFRYEHDPWVATLAALRIDKCSDRDARKRAAEAAAAAARAEQLYQAGNTALRDQDNPLYQEICAEDIEPLRRRLAAGPPRFNMSSKLWECAIERPRPDFFALLLPALYAHTEERDGYCGMMRSLHRQRLLDFLAIAAEQKLPLVCPGENAADWRDGISPFDAHGSHVWDPPAEQTYRWLSMLKAQQVPICETTPTGDNLLRTYIVREPARTIELLLDAGCDVHVRPKRNPQPGFDEKSPYSASVLWMLRRFSDGQGNEAMPRVEADRIADISRRMGDVSASELTEPDPNTGRTFLDDYHAAVIREPALLRYLLSRGVRLDASAHNIPMSWYYPGYNPSNNNELLERPMLDELSVAQLRELITPVDTLTHQPAKPMPEVQNFSPAGLGTYLCRRQVIDCPR